MAMNNNSNNGRRNAMGGQQTYIEIEVPLRQSAEWMGELKQVM